MSTMEYPENANPNISVFKRDLNETNLFSTFQIKLC